MRSDVHEWVEDIVGLTVRTFEAINVPDDNKTSCNRTTVIEAADVDDDANILGYCYHNALAIATQWSPFHAAAAIIIIIKSLWA